MKKHKHIWIRFGAIQFSYRDNRPLYCSKCGIWKKNNKEHL